MLSSNNWWKWCSFERPLGQNNNNEWKKFIRIKIGCKFKFKSYLDGVIKQAIILCKIFKKY